MSDQRVIPLLAKTLYQRFFQKLIQANTLATTQNLGTLANLPAVKVHSLITWEALDTHGIKVTRYRFAPFDESLAIGFFDGTQTHASALISCEHTVGATHKLCNKFSLHINKSDTMLFNLFLSLGQQIVPHFWQYLF